MASPMQAALHMDPSYENNLNFFRNSEFEGNSEIKNVFTADVASSLWEKPVLLNEQAIKWMKSRVYVYSDSVLCLGKHVQKMQSKSGIIKCQL